MLSIETDGDLAWGSPIKRKPPKKALMDEENALLYHHTAERQ
jgi:hypothetical protein